MVSSSFKGYRIRSSRKSRRRVTTIEVLKMGSTEKKGASRRNKQITIQLERGKFWQQTGSKGGRNNQFWDMDFLQNGLIYLRHEKLSQNSEAYGRYMRGFEHIFHRCGQLRSSVEFLLVIYLFKQQSFVCKGGEQSLETLLQERENRWRWRTLFSEDSIMLLWRWRTLFSSCKFCNFLIF